MQEALEGHVTHIATTFMVICRDKLMENAVFELGLFLC